MIKSKITYNQLLVVGSSSVLSKELSLAFPNATFFGRSNPYNFKNWVKLESLDSSSGINSSKNIITGSINWQNPTTSHHLVLLQGVSSVNWEESVYVNLISVSEIAELFAKKLQTKNSQGSITMIGSASATLGGKIQYSSTKSALHGIQNSLLKNYSSNVRVNLIVPGVFRGGMIADWDNDKIAEVSQKTYSKRPGSAEEIADSIKFVILNKYVSGSVINMTNGQIK